MRISAENPSNERGRSDSLSVWFTAATCWYLTALLVALAISLGLHLLRPAPDGPPRAQDWLKTFNWMDGRWYRQIAVEGYHYDPNARSNVAFYPVYPLLARSLIAVTGMRAEAALLLVSNVSFLAALLMLGLYAQARYPHEPRDSRDFVLLAAALYPAGCFFRLTYSESTCLLLLILAMYSMLRRWPLWACAALAGLATASRPVAIALAPAFAIHLWRCGCVGDDCDRARRTASLCRRSVLYVPLATWGLAAFFAFQAYEFGDALATVKVQRHWRVRADVGWPEKTASLAALEPIRAVYGDPTGSAYWGRWQPWPLPWFSLQFANPIFFISAILLTTIGAWRRWLNWEEIALAYGTLIIPYLSRAHEMGMVATARFTAVAFPIYLVLGHICMRTPSLIRCLVLSLAAFFLAIYTALYAAGYDVL